MNTHTPYDKFAQALSAYTQYYYSLTTRGAPRQKPSHITTHILSMAQRAGYQAENVTDLNRQLAEDGHHLDLTAFKYAGETPYVNILLGDTVEKMRKQKEIFQFVVNYDVHVLQNLTVKSFDYFITQGQTSYSTFSKGNQVIHIWDYMYKQGENIWDYMSGARCPFGELYVKMCLQEWGTLTRELAHQHTEVKAKDIFATYFAKQRMDDAEFHELYHIVTRNIQGKSTPNIQEEIAAELTKFIHTPLRCGTLTTNVTRMYRNKNSRAYKTGEWIFKKFINQIRLKQSTGADEYKNINVPDGSELEQISEFYKLSSTQIKEIANDVFFSLS